MTFTKPPVSDEAIDKASDLILETRIRDYFGWQAESFSEASAEDRAVTADLVLKQDFSLLGKHIYTMIIDYCKPSDDEAIAQAEYDRETH